MLEVIGNNVKFAASVPVNTSFQPFTGETLNISKPDEFVKQDKKEEKKLSTGQKLGIGAGILAFGGVIAAAILSKGKTLKPANFAEHIDFKPAQTMEEAVEFAKRNFGVKTFDFGDDLEFANWVNEGLVNINNRFKGKANIVENLRFASPEEVAKYTKDDGRAAIGWCNSFSKHGDNSSIVFNKNSIDNAHKRFNDFLKKLKIQPKFDDTGEIVGGYICGADRNTHTKILKLSEKMLKEPDKFSRFDAMNGIMLCDDYMNSIMYFDKNKLSILKNKIFTDADSAAILKENNISVNIDDYAKLGEKELKEQTEKILKLLVDVNPVSGTATVRGNSKFDVIYHEMGHHLHAMNTSLKDSIWGRLSKKVAKLFKSDPEKQKTAGIVSWYAQTNPKEFVAECFNALCAGRKLPDDVMKMYEYYKGPMLPNM